MAEGKPATVKLKSSLTTEQTHTHLWQQFQFDVIALLLLLSYFLPVGHKINSFNIVFILQWQRQQQSCTYPGCKK